MGWVPVGCGGGFVFGALRKGEKREDWLMRLEKSEGREGEIGRRRDEEGDLFITLALRL